MFEQVPTDQIEGWLVLAERHRLLVSGIADRANFPGLVGTASRWLVRYAFAHGFTPGLRIFPTQSADDWGQIREGLEAIEWVARAGQRHPRSEVWGMHQDGSPAEYFNRDLDLALPLTAYAGQGEVFPGEQLDAAVRVVEADEMALEPDDDWPVCLGLSVPTWKIHVAVIEPAMLARLGDLIESDTRTVHVSLNMMADFLNGEGFFSNE